MRRCANVAMSRSPETKEIEEIDASALQLSDTLRILLLEPGCCATRQTVP